MPTDRAEVVVARITAAQHGPVTGRDARHAQVPDRQNDRLVSNEVLGSLPPGVHVQRRPDEVVRRVTTALAG